MRNLLQISAFIFLSSISNLFGGNDDLSKIYLSNLSHSTELDQAFKIFVDSLNHFKIDDVRSMKFYDPVILNKIEHPGYLDHTFWMSVLIVNDLNKDTTLLLSPGRFKKCQLFVDDENDTDKLFGFAMSRKNWPCKISPDYFPITLEKNSQHILYIKASKHVENQEQNIKFSLLGEEQLLLSFQKGFKESTTLYGCQLIFFGIMICLIIFSLISLIQYNDKSYLYFMFINIMAIVYFLELLQRDPIYESYFGLYNHHGDHYNMLPYLGGVFIFLFLDAFLSLKETLPKLHLLYIGTVIFFMLALVTHIFLLVLDADPSLLLKMNIVFRGASTFPIIISLLYLAFKDWSLISRIIIFGLISLTFLDSLTIFLENSLLISNRLMIKHPQILHQIGFGLQSFSFLLALVIKQKGVLNEKNEVQLELINQLQENNELSNQLNSKLQVEVDKQSKIIVRQTEEKLSAQYNEKLTKLESQMLRSRMNPHFIFNSLNSIDNFVLNNQSLEASDYLTKFSKLMRNTLDYSRRAKITLQEEVENLKLYIQMEQLRFSKKFSFEIINNQSLDLTHCELPPLTLQPFVENAIWHGILHLEHPGVLKLIIEKKDDHHVISVDDNGIGRASALKNKSLSAVKNKSYGMKITQERLDLDQNGAGSVDRIEIIDKVDEMGLPIGTTVIIRIPF